MVHRRSHGKVVKISSSCDKYIMVSSRESANACSLMVSVELLARNGLFHVNTILPVWQQTLTQTFAGRSPTECDECIFLFVCVRSVSSSATANGSWHSENVLIHFNSVAFVFARICARLVRASRGALHVWRASETACTTHLEDFWRRMDNPFEWFIVLKFTKQKEETILCHLSLVMRDCFTLLHILIDTWRLHANQLHTTRCNAMNLNK